MSEKRITPESFDRDLRETLRYRHGFEHEDLERAKGIIADAVAHVEEKAHTRLGMGSAHVDMAMKFLNEKHEGWKNLPEHQQRHIETALREHFGMHEPENEGA